MGPKVGPLNILEIEINLRKMTTHQTSRKLVTQKFKIDFSARIVGGRLHEFLHTSSSYNNRDVHKLKITQKAESYITKVCGNPV